MSICRVVRVRFDRLPVIFGSFPVVFQVVTRQPDVEVRLGGRPQTDCFLRSFDGLTVTAKFLAAKSRLRPGLSIAAVSLCRLLKRT